MSVGTKWLDGVSIRVVEELPYPFDKAVLIAPSPNGQVRLTDYDGQILTSVRMHDVWHLAASDCTGCGSPVGMGAYLDGSGYGDFSDLGDGFGIGLGGYGGGDLYLEGRGHAGDESY